MFYFCWFLSWSQLQFTGRIAEQSHLAPAPAPCISCFLRAVIDMCGCGLSLFFSVFLSLSLWMCVCTWTRARNKKADSWNRLVCITQLTGFLGEGKILGIQHFPFISDWLSLSLGGIRILHFESLLASSKVTEMHLWHEIRPKKTYCFLPGFINVPFSSLLLAPLFKPYRGCSLFHPKAFDKLL